MNRTETAREYAKSLKGQWPTAARQMGVTDKWLQKFATTDMHGAEWRISAVLRHRASALRRASRKKA